MRDDEEVAPRSLPFKYFSSVKRRGVSAAEGREIIVIKAGWFENKSGTRRTRADSWLAAVFGYL